MKLIKNQWTVRPIQINEARGFVEQYHYAKGAAKTAVGCFGLFYKGDPNTLHGISWWMPPPLGAAKSVSEDHRSVLALSRFCLVEDRPANAGSFLISKSIKLLDKRWSLLLTYADTALNHDGGLYHASNWNYDGLTRKNPLYWNPGENCMVSRKKGPKTYNHKEMLDLGYEYKGKFSKHRFVYPASGRKNIIVKPRKPSPLLLFTEDGKIKLNSDE
jgi:hypothetical protein